MTLALDHIQLAIPPDGETAARAFWCDLLGLAEIEKPVSLRGRGGCWFTLDEEAELHLGIEDPFAPAKKAHPGLRAADIDNLAATLAKAGHDIAWDDTIPGRRRFFTSDPFGNRLEFLT